MGVSIDEILHQKFLFQFRHKADIRRIVEGGLWAYDNHLLVYEKVQPREDLGMVTLDKVVLWVQVHEVPLGYMSEVAAKGIAEKLEVLLEIDPITSQV